MDKMVKWACVWLWLGCLLFPTMAFSDSKAAFEALVEALSRYDTQVAAASKKEGWDHVAQQFPQYVKGIEEGDIAGVLLKALETGEDGPVPFTGGPQPCPTAAFGEDRAAAWRNCGVGFKAFLADFKRLQGLLSGNVPRNLEKAAWWALKERHPDLVEKGEAGTVATVFLNALDRPCLKPHQPASSGTETKGVSAPPAVERPAGLDDGLTLLMKYWLMEMEKMPEPLIREAWQHILGRYPQHASRGKAGLQDFLETFLKNDPRQLGHQMAVCMGLSPMRRNHLGMTFVYVAPRPFLMGSPRDEWGRGKDEGPFPASVVRGFYIQTTEVTQGQWEDVMGKNPATFTECGPECPVEDVSFKDAQAFIAALNQHPEGARYRLPWEAEWELACRSAAPAGAWFHFGSDETELKDHAWYKDNAGGTTHPVAGRKPSALGLYDLHGNVWELCQDWDWPYPIEQTANPSGTARGTYKVARGGSWYHPMSEARCANRFYVLPAAPNYSVGFRLVMEP